MLLQGGIPEIKTVYCLPVPWSGVDHKGYCPFVCKLTKKQSGLVLQHTAMFPIVYFYFAFLELGFMHFTAANQITFVEVRLHNPAGLLKLSHSLIRCLNPACKCNAIIAGSFQPLQPISFRQVCSKRSWSLLRHKELRSGTESYCTEKPRNSQTWGESVG